MRLSAIDQIFWIAGFCGQLILLVTLVFRRRLFSFPFFTSSILTSILTDFTLFWVTRHAAVIRYEEAYVFSAILDYTLQLAILIEISRSVLSPDSPMMRKPPSISLLLFLGVVFGTTALWVLDRKGQSGVFSLTTAKLVQLNLVFAFLRMTLFALIAGFSQMLGITWRNHVLRLAAGLAFYSAISLVIQLTISHLPQLNAGHYMTYFNALQRSQVIAYLATLSFWVWSFVQKDAPRKEFTPQMQRFLVTITESARRSRMIFARSEGHE